MDLAFWYLHAHFTQLAALATPMLVAVFAMAVVLVSITQTLGSAGCFAYVLYAIVAPTIVLWLGVFLPLPSAVFAWRRASGTLPETGECFQFCVQRMGGA